MTSFFKSVIGFALNQPHWLLQQTSEQKVTKIHTLTPLTYELFFFKHIAQKRILLL